MELIKVKTKYQITLPAVLRKQAGINIGDIFTATIKKGEITLKAKSLIDKGVDEGLADIKAGRTYGPFETAGEMFKVLESNRKKYKAQTKKK